MSPLFDTEPFDLLGIEGAADGAVELEARATDGRIAMVATARFGVTRSDRITDDA